MTTQDMLDNEVRQIYLLRRHALKVLDRELCAHGLGHGTYKYLYALFVEDRRSQQALADRVGDDKAAATRALARLEKLGFIHREPDTEDRRMIVVSLTPSGEALRPEIVAAVGEACHAMTATLEADEAALFRRLLAKAVAGVEVSAN